MNLSKLGVILEEQKHKNEYHWKEGLNDCHLHEVDGLTEGVPLVVIARNEPWNVEVRVHYDV